MKRLLYPLFFLCVMVATFLLPSPGVAQWVKEDHLSFDFVNLEDKPELRSHLRRALRHSRDQIETQVHIRFEGPVLVVWTDGDDFMERTGFKPENTAAAANARLGTIWINSDAWMRSTAQEQQRTLTHELGHLVVGNLPGGAELPLWANEGIVMHLAGEFNWEEHVLLLWGHFFGGLPELESLEETFPRQPGSQNVAYRMAYAATAEVAASYGDRPGSVSRLMRRLADPVTGPQVAAELRDSFRREGFQLATEQSLGSRFSAGVILMSSTGTIFLLMGVLFLVAYAITRKRRARWDEENNETGEPWEASLTDEDIQDIYGDREDRWDDQR